MERVKAREGCNTCHCGNGFIADRTLHFCFSCRGAIYKVMITLHFLLGVFMIQKRVFYVLSFFVLFAFCLLIPFLSSCIHVEDNSCFNTLSASTCPSCIRRDSIHIVNTYAHRLCFCKEILY